MVPKLFWLAAQKITKIWPRHSTFKNLSDYGTFWELYYLFKSEKLDITFIAVNFLAHFQYPHGTVLFENHWNKEKDYSFCIISFPHFMLNFTRSINSSGKSNLQNLKLTNSWGTQKVDEIQLPEYFLTQKIYFTACIISLYLNRKI